MATWPLIEDLIDVSPYGISTDLVKSLTERCEKLGEKYATEEIHEESGLKINSCMNRDTLQELYEELVDAVFNCLVYMFRFPGRKNGGAKPLLALLLEACSQVDIEKGKEYGSRLRG